MTLFQPLRSELYKYRKNRGRSIDGVIPGTAGRFRKLTTPSTGAPIRGVGYAHDLYMADVPQQYRPNIFAPHVDWAAYEQEHLHEAPHARTPQPNRGFDSSVTDVPLGHAMPRDELALTEQWLMNMGARPRPQEGPVFGTMEEIRPLLDGVHTTIHEQERPVTHTVPKLEDVAEAIDILEKSLPGDHPDIVNLRQAMRIMSGQLSAPIEDSLPQAVLPIEQAAAGLPEHAALPEAMELDFGLPDDLSPLEHILDEMAPAPEPGPASSPSPVEMPMPGLEGQMHMDMAGYDGTLATAEIEQAIDQMMAMPKQEELEEQMKYDPFAAGVQQFEQALQYMADPFMNPGQMGPLGPMPGPGF